MRMPVPIDLLRVVLSGCFGVGWAGRLGGGTIGWESREVGIDRSVAPFYQPAEHPEIITESFWALPASRHGCDA
jgi:hypothetical protein